MEDDPRVALGRVRLRLRKIDADIAKIRRETNFFRQMGFGRDIKDIQLQALEDERSRRQAELSQILQQLCLQPNRGPGLRALLSLPLTLLSSALGGGSAREREPIHGGAVPIRWQSLPGAQADSR